MVANKYEILHDLSFLKDNGSQRAEIGLCLKDIGRLSHICWQQLHPVSQILAAAYKGPVFVSEIVAADLSRAHQLGADGAFVCELL